jgi:hypothetical protein
VVTIPELPDSPPAERREDHEKPRVVGTGKYDIAKEITAMAITRPYIAIAATTAKIPANMMISR